jgi:hypothetical protein
VYLPRQLSATHLVTVLVLTTACLFFIFWRGGGKIQHIVRQKTGTRFIRSATIVDFFYACILLIFKEWGSTPMSTTWVFVGLLTGRELAIAHFHMHWPKIRGSEINAITDLEEAKAILHPLAQAQKHWRKAIIMAATDFGKVLAGLIASLLIALLLF